MTTLNLTIRFGTLTGQDAARTYTGDLALLGFVPPLGMPLTFNVSPEAIVVVRDVRHVVGSGVVSVIADARLFEDVPTARAFATAFTNRAQALGFTVQP